MFNESQLAILKRAVRVLVEHEQRVAGAVQDDLAELFYHLHAPVVESAPASTSVVESEPVVETPAEDATLASTEK